MATFKKQILKCVKCDAEKMKEETGKQGKIGLMTTEGGVLRGNRQD